MLWLAIPFLRGRQKRERENLYVDRWNHHSHNWCRLVQPATLSVIRLRQSDRHHMLLFGWLVFHGERGRVDAVRRQRPSPSPA
jgi:hypothetical protein